MQAIPAAPGGTSIDFQPFIDLGCNVHGDGNFEVLKSPIGTNVFCKEYCNTKVNKATKVLDAVVGLNDPQVAHYLLANSVNACRMNYMCRTTPAATCAEAANNFDKAVVNSAAAALGQKWTQRQETQASFGTKQAGLGLQNTGDVVDAAYFASGAGTHALCTAIRPEHTWDAAVAGSDLAAATRRLGIALPDPAILDGELHKISQKELNSGLRRGIVDRWKATGPPEDRVRHQAFSAKGSGKLFGVIPSKTLDMQLSTNEFATNVACLLGVDVLEGDTPCPMCGSALDVYGIHPLSCMCGGDQTYEHNAVRDVIYDYSERGLLGPALEKPHLLVGIDGPSSRERPADVLVIPNMVFARKLPDGSRAIKAERVCLDVAVINALGPGHWAETAQEGGIAADNYGVAKSQRNDLANRCKAQGLQYRALVFEQQGGRSKEAELVIHAIANAVAMRENIEAATVRREILQRIALVIGRSVASRIARRTLRKPVGRMHWHRVLTAAQCLTTWQ